MRNVKLEEDIKLIDDFINKDGVSDLKIINEAWDRIKRFVEAKEKVNDELGVCKKHHKQ